jgi:hypothetical protein
MTPISCGASGIDAKTKQVITPKIANVALMARAFHARLS